MQIERFYLGCLAHASYLVADGGEAAIIDPQRDVELYLDETQSRGLRIRWVIETHLHADFVSGHLELARRSGAAICLGAGSGASFEHRELADGDELPLGGGKLRILATPGHTEESISILAIAPEQPHAPLAVFTGDTLFINGCGRCDLPGSDPKIMYNSLYNILMKLPDETIIYSGHNYGPTPTDTIRHQKQTNPYLQAKSLKEFLKERMGL